MKNFNIVFDDREIIQIYMKCYLMVNISNNNRNLLFQLKKISFIIIFSGVMFFKDI